MHNILRTLRVSQLAVDLGCGGGSFNYAAYPCKIVGIDVALKASTLYRDGNRVHYIQSSATEIPIDTHSVDAVICNHTFEHFSNYTHTLAEIDRILNCNGMLWIAIPNGYGFDDSLYRLIFGGGGHVNRFTFDRLIQEVHTLTDLKLIQSITLFSGFVYLKRPTVEQFQYFPERAKKRARFLFYLPEPLSRGVILAMNAATRLADKLIGSRISQYGWGFVFARGEVELESLPSYFNVCWNCGSGNDAEYLRSAGRVTSFLGLPIYSCANCQARSVFFNPPEGLS